MDLYLLVVTTKDVVAAEVTMVDAGFGIDIDEYNVLNEDGCVDPVESRLEVMRYTGVPVVERNCVVACVAVEDERKIQRLLNVLYDEIEAIDPDVSLVDSTVTVIEIAVGIVEFLTIFG